MAPAIAPIALTMGEPGGIGGEIAVKAWNALKATGPAFFLIDDPDRIEALGAPVATISAVGEAAEIFAARLPVLPLPLKVVAYPGVAAPANAGLVSASVAQAVTAALAGKASAIVTNPIQKSSMIAGGFAFPGHTEYLDALTEGSPMPAGRSRGPAMMLAAPGLRVVPVTVHIPLRRVAEILTVDAIVDVGWLAAEALIHDFGLERPRLAVAGLNPHAGEDGALGDEDARIIRPAIEALKREGIEVAGPLPADSMFHVDARARYDAAICMYHDQALIPVKTLAFHEAVNVTLGLPIVRTSPDHGTALDIAGKGLARPDSLIAAIRLAAEIAARRAA